MKITNISHSITNHNSMGGENKMIKTSCLVEYMGEKKVFNTMQMIDNSRVVKDNDIQRRLFINLINEITKKYGFQTIETIEV